MGQFAQQVRVELHRAQGERHVDFLSRGEPLADSHAVGRRFPGQGTPMRRLRRVRRRLGAFESRVGHVRVLVPGQPVVQQRLAEPVVIEPRQPLGFGEEGIHPRRRKPAPGAVVEILLQLDAGRLVLELIVFALEVLFEEVEIGDQPDFAGELEIVGQHLPVLREDATAEVFFGRNVAAIETQVIDDRDLSDPQMSTNPLVLSGTPNNV